MKKIFALMLAVALTNTAFACPVPETCQEGLTGYGYYDSMGHYCEYGGYWECGQWIQTVGYWECGQWVPAQYDPMLDVGYYDECGQYHYYSQYGQADVWACDDRRWLEEEYGYYGQCQQAYEEEENYGCQWQEEESYSCSYYEEENYSYCYGEEGNYSSCYYYEEEEDYGCSYGTGYYIDVDLDADCISIVNNGVIILSAPCTCTSAYRGQELSFGDLRCAGIWNTCSGGFYEEACGYVDSSCDVRCH